MPNAVELERLAAQVIHDPPGRADDDVHAGAQPLDLLLHAWPP